MSNGSANNGWAYSDRARSTDSTGANANGGTGGGGGGGDGKKAELPKYAKESERVMSVYLVDTSVGALDMDSMVQGTRENIKKTYAALANNMSLAAATLGGTNIPMLAATVDVAALHHAAMPEVLVVRRDVHLPRAHLFGLGRQGRRPPRDRPHTPPRAEQVGRAHQVRELARRDTAAAWGVPSMTPILYYSVHRV